MTKPCAQRNPLVRSGMTRQARERAELGTRHFLPDERELADLILFGQRFARHVQFYAADNSSAGDWSVFFDSDLSASLAGLSRLPVERFRTSQLDLENWLKAEPARDPAQLSAHLRLAFHLPLVLLQQAAAGHARLPQDHPFSRTLLELALRELGTPLRGLIGWYKGALPASLGADSLFSDAALDMADYNLAGAPGDQRLHLSSTVATAIAGQPAFSNAPLAGALLQRLDTGGWTALYAATTADSSPWEDAIGQPHQRYEQIYDALNYNLLTTAVEHIYQALERIRRDAASHLAASLESFAGHLPHYGLWLTFLQLFQHARDELNQFTARHLDFYFREVLRLGNRAQVPDQVHLLFELARGVAAHRLSAGTLLRAGKDALGRPLSFALDHDLVVNRARVSELRGLQLLRAGTQVAPELTPLAASVVRSQDGLGEVKLVGAQPAWPAFGPLASPHARIGLAVSDRKLFLREGSRSIVLRAELQDKLPATSLAPRWRVRLTAAKGWLELRGTTAIQTLLDNRFDPEEEAEAPAQPARGQQQAAQKAAQKSGKQRAREEREIEPFRQQPRSPRGQLLQVLQVTVTLDADDPAIIPLDSKLHGSDYPPGVPVMELIWDFDGPSPAESAASARAFAALRELRASRLTLACSASGLKNLSVLGGTGLVDPAKPFAPFGAQPLRGSFWTLGSSEIFSKPIAHWSLGLDWGSSYSSSGFFRSRSAEDYNPQESVLSAGQWLEVPSRKGRAGPKKGMQRAPVVDTDIGLGETGVSVEMKGARLIDGLCAQTLDNPALTPASINGFVRLRLPTDFGHSAFVRENALALIDKAGGDTWGAPTGVNASGGLPRLPYDPLITRLEAAYSTTRDSVQGFRLLHPFGLSAGSADGRLFPALPFSAALLIGVEDFEPPARLSLLVQVLDGSGDPLRAAPPLQFHYLQGDAWVALDAQDVDDRTRNFSSSGLLTLDVPATADREHRVLPSGLHWLRIAVNSDADALNQLLSIDAQGARARFVDAGNDPLHIASPLPAGSISKLLTPDQAVKKISQPYSSFGGRPCETSGEFAIRVSERLRHKDRAVTLWDYEALVLEAFPQLYRVKCLNTTELRRDAQNRVIGDNEQMPGAVTVVSVPWTHGSHSRNPLRPYTDQATLTAVDAFLRKRISPFVRLTVQNPKFEEVHLDFAVKFRPEIGDIAFCIDELNQAIVAFLSPWSQPGGGEITFGGRLWKSTLIDFVEEQAPVDYVIDFRLYHKIDIEAADGGWTPVDVELIEATTARSILVSAARHSIREVPGNA